MALLWLIDRSVMVDLRGRRLAMAAMPEALSAAAFIARCCPSELHVSILARSLCFVETLLVGSAASTANTRWWRADREASLSKRYLEVLCIRGLASTGLVSRLLNFLKQGPSRVAQRSAPDARWLRGLPAIDHPTSRPHT